MKSFDHFGLPHGSPSGSNKAVAGPQEHLASNSFQGKLINCPLDCCTSGSHDEFISMTASQVWAERDADKLGFQNLQGSGEPADLVCIPNLKCKTKMTELRFLLDSGRTWQLETVQAAGFRT